MAAFQDRLRESIAAHSPLCVGIDPSARLLAACGLPDSAEGALEFGQRVLEAAEYQLSVIKPQSAYFERFGSAGYAAMEQLAQLARRRGVLVLLDGKRGDIDSTGTAYAEGYFSARSPLQVDAVTVHPYLGIGALQPFFDTAVRHDGGVFVVVRSSNPEGSELQNARVSSGETVAQFVGREITESNRKVGSTSGPIGAVVGATCDDAATIVDTLPASFILAPGVGAQGATMQDIARRMPAARGRVLPNVSRAILANGAARDEIRATIRALQDQARTLL